MALTPEDIQNEIARARPELVKTLAGEIEAFIDQQLKEQSVHGLLEEYVLDAGELPEGTHDRLWPEDDEDCTLAKEVNEELKKRYSRWEFGWDWDYPDGTFTLKPRPSMPLPPEPWSR
jgi:hypothetical protein